jgi:hypothetical protein
MAPADLERVATSILRAVDDVSSRRWDLAVQRAAALPGDLRPQKLAALTASMSREVAAAGAAAGAVAATPLIGTVGTLAAGMTELAWFTTRAGDLILTIAALHGRPDPTEAERRAWVLAVLLYGGAAHDGLALAINEANTGHIANGLGTPHRVPIAVIHGANRVLAKQIVRRYGTRRGAVALGKALPLGVGAAFGGTANYVAIQRLARHADSLFARLPYSAIDTTAIEATMIDDTTNDTTNDATAGES